MNIMKKFFIYLFASATFLTVYKANAQQGFSLSVKGIPQFSMMYNKDDNNNSNYSKKTAFNGSFGLGAGYNFDQNFGAGVDVFYSLQGQRYQLSGPEYNQKNDYIKVPVYFSYNTDPSKKISFIGKLGPQISFLTSSKLDDKNGNTINGNTKDQYKNATFGAMISAGAQYKLNNNLYLNAAWRFDYDFTNAEDDQYADYTSGRANTHNMTSGLEVGLKYMLKN
jgi:outer membrane protein with beta-barrel domain